MSNLKHTLRQLLDSPLTDTDLWTLLTALRGPDDLSPERKRLFTADIRARLGLDGSLDEIPRLYMAQKLETSQIKHREPEVLMLDHFVLHAMQALDVLVKFEAWQKARGSME